MQALTLKTDLLKSVVNLSQSFFVLCGALVLFSSLVSVKAQGIGGSIQVIVTDQNEVPIPQANVCFVLSNQTIGGKQTDSSGRYNATLPLGPVTVHVSKQGFLNGQQDFNIASGNIVHQFRLQPGTSTASPAGCGTILGSTTTGNNCIRITDFRAVGGTTTTNPRVTVRATFDQYPRAYRIHEFTAAEQQAGSSCHTDFDPDCAFRRLNVPWHSMPPGHMARDGNTLELEINLNPDAFGPGYGEFGTHTIYLEVAKVALDDPSTPAPVDSAGCVSNTKVLSVVLAPAKLKTYTLTGAALQTFINQARDRGYTFSVHEDVILANKICAGDSLIFFTSRAQARLSNTAVEIIRGSFEVFAGPDLNQFWKLKSIDASHADFPIPVVSIRTDGSQPALEFNKEVTGSGGPNSIKRTFHWRRTAYQILGIGTYNPLDGSFRSNDIGCILRQPKDAALTELVLEGPDGKNPIDALPNRP